MSENSGLRLIHLGVPQGILAGVVGAFFTGLLQTRGSLPQGDLIQLLGGLLFAALGMGINYAVMKGGERVATSFYNPSGDSNAYTPSFSNIEAMEIRGDLEGAAKAWEAACAEQPGNAIVLVKTADFYLRLKKDNQAALARYRSVRDLADVSPDLARYASQKLVDLYLGPLADEGRAMVELRRLVDRFPGTREANDARAVLAKLKADRSTPR